MKEIHPNIQCFIEELIYLYRDSASVTWSVLLQLVGQQSFMSHDIYCTWCDDSCEGGVRKSVVFLFYVNATAFGLWMTAPDINMQNVIIAYQLVNKTILASCQVKVKLYPICVRLSSISKLRRYWSCAAGFLIRVV